MKIYHNPRCRKSREALSILQEHNIPVDIVEYFKVESTDVNDDDSCVESIS